MTNTRCAIGLKPAARQAARNRSALARWRHDVITDISCAPGATANYFTHSDLPYETSPAFFNPEVLTKYKADSEKYRLADRSIHCRGTWSLKTYDINEAGQVHTYIVYLRDLPCEEQLHWKAHNERPKAPISKRAITTDFEGRFDPEYDPLRSVKSIVRELDEAQPPWWTLRSEKLLDTANYPVPHCDHWDHHERQPRPRAPYLLQGAKHPSPIGIQTIRGRLRALSVAAGARRADGRPLVLLPHDCRRVFASEHLNNNVPVHVIQALLGHSTRAATLPASSPTPRSTSWMARSRASSSQALPSGSDEAAPAATSLSPLASTRLTVLLVGQSATEQALKQQALDEFRVLHFAVHGILSPKFPARSALVVRPGGGEDGLLQAREVLAWRLGADLVTLSACDTGSGTLYGQDGVSSLVRPFLAAGARAVVANLWAANDRFSLSLMRAFYREVAGGSDVAEALRRAKLTMLEQFGVRAVPKLWSGVLAYGDATAMIVPPGPDAQ